MKTVDLRNYWKKLRALKNGVPAKLKVSDFWLLEELTADEKLLTRKEIEGLLRQERDKAWYLEQIKKGNKPIFCQQCQRHHYADTTCFSFKFNRPGPTDIVISQKPASVVLRPITPPPDMNKLHDEQSRIDSQINRQLRVEAFAKEIAEEQRRYDEEVQKWMDELKKLTASVAITEGAENSDSQSSNRNNVEEGEQTININGAQYVLKKPAPQSQFFF